MLKKLSYQFTYGLSYQFMAINLRTLLPIYGNKFKDSLNIYINEFVKG